MSEGGQTSPAGSPATKGLGKKTLRGIAWTLFGSVLSNALRIVVLAVLGRLLAPAEFGEVAAGLTVIALGQVLKDLGVGLALVQRREIEPGHVEAAFGFSLLIALVLSGAMFAAAPLVADLYRLPEAASLVRALSLMFLLRGLASTSVFLCQRDMSFRALALIDTAGYALGSTVAIALAAAGIGAWSLVIGYLVEASLGAAALLAIRPPPFRFRMRWRPLRDLLGFGSGQTAAGIANYFANQGDYIVVGRYLDAAALGFYTRAYELIRYPSVIFQNIFGSVFFSSFSKLQGDPVRLGQAYRRVLFVNALLLLPTSAALIVLAPEGIRLLMGPGWDAAAPPPQSMALSMLFRTSYKAGGIVARSSGDVFQMAGWQVVYAVAVTGGALLTVRWGPTGVACTTALAVALHFLALSRLALRRVDLRWSRLALAHLPGLAAAGLVVAGALPVALFLRAAGASAAVIAAAGALAGCVGPAGFFLLAIRARRPDWVWLVETLRQVAGKKRRKANKAAAAEKAEKRSRAQADPSAPAGRRRGMEASAMAAEAGASATPIVVAIDGPAGAGKSTAAKRLTALLGYRLLDTGALYRSVALLAHRRGVPWGDEEALAAVAAGLEVEFRLDGMTNRLFLAGEDVTTAIRTPAMSEGSSRVSAFPKVRAALLDLQRALAGEGGVVAEGRDVGTVVLPRAQAKFFLTASDEVRAQRRHEELCAAGVNADLGTTLAEMQQRDQRDTTRAAAPLVPAPDAVILDSSALTIDEVVERMLDVVRRRERAIE